MRVRDGRVRAHIEGPENPFLRRPQKVRAEFTAYPDRSNQFAKIVVGSEQRLLKVGEWSDWVPVEFAFVPTQTLGGEVRFFLKRVAPFFELYASPVNLDPLSPAMPVSTPPEYAEELAEATGRFYTQGMPEDTKGLRTGVLTDADFLTQAKSPETKTSRIPLRPGPLPGRVPVLLLRQRGPGGAHDVARAGPAASGVRRSD